MTNPNVALNLKEVSILLPNQCNTSGWIKKNKSYRLMNDSISPLVRKMYFIGLEQATFFQAEVKPYSVSHGVCLSVQ